MRKLPPALIFFSMLMFGCSSTDKQDTLFTLLPPSETGVSFANQLDESDHFNIIKYLYFYNGGGVATGDVNNDGLPDIFFTANQLPNKFYLNKGNFQFEDATERAGLKDVGEPGRSWKTGVAMADVNGDGWLDIYVCEVGFYKSVNGRNRLYLNNRDGTFSEQAEAYGLAFKGFSQQAGFFDYDLDGDLDLFLATHSVHSAESYSKAENRTLRDSVAGDVLFRNDGGHFTDVSEQAGIFGGTMGYGLSLLTADLNGDGWPDIYVTNDFHENDYLYLNNHDGTFTEVIATATGHTSTFSMGVDAADLNNDGLTDIMTLDMKPEDESILKISAGVDHYNLYQMKLGYGYHYQYPRNCLQWALAYDRNEGRPTLPRYAEVAELAGVATTDWSWSTLLADFDNDGWKDIFITNGIWRRPNDLDYLKFASKEEVLRNATDRQLASKMPQGIVPNIAFRNRGGAIATFENVSKQWGLDLAGCSNGAAYADFDNDGDLDLVINNLNAPAALYRNNSEVVSKNNFIKIKLAGENGNRFGAGATVMVTAGGLTQVQELSPTRGWQSSSDYVLNFGLGKNETIEKLTVTWPGGQQQILTQLPANQTLTLTQSDAGASSPITHHQSPIFQSTNLPVYHKENRFVDFNIEPLMPHMLSTQGPKLAVGDVNGDGLEDFYLCGAKAQAGQLQLAVNSGQWQASNQGAFEQDFLCEDADARFFDADGDGDLDLFVVSGGGEYREGAEQLQDRLYLNDGRGNFTKKTDVNWPATNGACAVPADFNGDGVSDLFIGSRSVPGSYGLTPRSFIYLNDGKGNFRDATAEFGPDIPEAGMVTSAVWLPDERRLVVAGEWMPLTVFDFSNPANSPIPQFQIPNSHGLWNSLAAADLDGDGDLDLLAGNEGLNTNLSASPQFPLELFVKDFDGNGATDPILTYYRQGKRFPFASRDELAAQMPFLKKQFPVYSTFAGSTFEMIFDEKTLEGAVRKQAETLQSTYFENLGDGNFKPTPLPLQAQTSPIHALLPGDFDGDGKMDVLAVGNFYACQPAIGRLDASQGWLLKGDGKGNFTAVRPMESGFVVPGEGRDLKFFKKTDGKQALLVARNDAEVMVFEER